MCITSGQLIEASSKEPVIIRIGDELFVFNPSIDDLVFNILSMVHKKLEPYCIYDTEDIREILYDVEKELVERSRYARAN